MKLILKDNIIYELQKGGGITHYWESIYSIIPHRYQLHEVNDTKYNRYRRIKSYFTLPHIVHSSYYRYSKNKCAINVTTLHDCVYEYYARGIKKTLHTKQKFSALKNSQCIICISHNTKNDLLKFYPSLKEKDICVIYNGFNTLNTYSEKPNQLRHGEQFFLFVGSRAKYKNYELAVQIAKLAKVKLVLVGGGNLSQTERTFLSSNLRSEYLHIKWAPDQQMKWLYKNAVSLLYPSYYEGFGMPPLEAMYRGCFSLCLDTPSNREVYGQFLPLCSSVEPGKCLDFIRYNIKNNVNFDRGLLTSKYNWEFASEQVFQLFDIHLSRS